MTNPNCNPNDQTPPTSRSHNLDRFTGNVFEVTSTVGDTVRKVTVLADQLPPVLDTVKELGGCTHLRIRSVWNRAEELNGQGTGGTA